MFRRIARCFGRTRKHATLTLHGRVDDKSGIPGVLLGGIFKAEILEETAKALKVRYTRKYIRSFGFLPVTWEEIEWMLKDDKRIVEVYEQ